MNLPGVPDPEAKVKDGFVHKYIAGAIYRLHARFVAVRCCLREFYLQARRTEPILEEPR